MGEIRLFSYKMTHDNGFAPNPFHGVLTLANCKPDMRINNDIGDWIAGFTSKELTNDEEDVKNPKLVYLMQVTDKIIYDKYWNSSEYEKKKPVWKSLDLKERAGDNIYREVNGTEEGFEFNDKKYKCLKNPNHEKLSEWKHDLKGKFVLVSNRFYYFGGNPIEIVKDRPQIPVYPAPYGYKTEGESAERFIKFIETNFHLGINHMPHTWKEEIKGCK